ncbi:MAG: hypothetical protein L3J71_03745 [Victivallaceae bacterium]|nr:hypothetical protein [Victivallaceae bacterium]
MEHKPRNMSFTTIFISVCRGVGDFPKLMNMAPFRVVLHLFFLAFIMALFITGSRSFSVFRSINMLCAEIEQQCGDFVMNEHGLRPAIEPDKAKKIYSADCSFRYFPGNDFKLETIEKDLNNIGVIWNPGIMLMWVKQPNDKYSAVPLVYPVLNNQWGGFDLIKRISDASSLSTAELADYVKNKGNPQGPFNMKFSQRGIEAARPAIKFYTAVIIFIAFFGQIFSQALLFTVIYSMIFAFVGGGRIRTLKFRQIFAVGTYCTFPAIFIASFFPALRLPFDYQTVFLFAFLIYLVVVFNFLQRFLAATEAIAKEITGK